MAGDRGHDELPTQTMHHFLFGKSFKFTVDVFHSPQMGNLMIPVRRTWFWNLFFLGGNPIPRRLLITYYEVVRVTQKLDAHSHRHTHTSTHSTKVDTKVGFVRNGNSIDFPFRFYPLSLPIPSPSPSDSIPFPFCGMPQRWRFLAILVSRITVHQRKIVATLTAR